MEDAKVFRLIEGLVENELGPCDDRQLDSVMAKCYSTIKEHERSDVEDGSDLQNVYEQVADSFRYDSRKASRFANLVSRLSEVSENGTLDRPAEILSFLHLLTAQDDDDLSSRLRYLGIRRVGDNSRGQYGASGTSEIGDGNSTSKDDSAGTQVSIGDILRSVHQDQQPTESALLQDFPYALQGLKTTSFTWIVDSSRPNSKGVPSKTQKNTCIEYPGTVSWPLAGLLNQLLEPSLLYHQLDAFTKHKENQCLTMQSLQNAISDELQNYQVLVGIIESRARGDQADGQLTLKRCAVLLQEATLGLRLLYSISRESEGLIGGNILSILQGYCYSGDEFVSGFGSRLLEKVSTPFFDILNAWMSSGTLVDPHKEFFVQLADESLPWTGRFDFKEDLVPSSMSSTNAKSVFDIGKTLYFIREVCKDNEWVDHRRSVTKRIANYTLLETVVTTIRQEVIEHLDSLLKDKFHLDLHLHALKDYLLLGKGDFAQILVEAGAPVFAKPVTRLLRHHLTSTLETAIRGSSAQHDSPEVLQYLDARMLERGHGDIGWEVFTLEYRIERPLDIVLLDKGGMTEYLRVFNFLWRIKRISFELNTGWRWLATAHREFLAVFSRYEEWELARSAYQEMLHFVGELQYYLSYEVIEVSWSKLSRKLANGKLLTVDDIIKAHREYLTEITFNGLLGGPPLIGELHEILKGVLSFKSSIDGLYELSVRMHSLDVTSDDRFDNISSQIASIKDGFEKRLQRLVYNLALQDKQEMKILAVRLDFNGFYTAGAR